MKKRMQIMLLFLGILFGLIFLIKGCQKIMISRYLASHQNPTVTVSAMTVKYSPWQPHLKAVGSTRAVTGVNVTTELAGMVQSIYFKPGTTVKAGMLLVQLNADTEKGQLQALKAQTELAKITYQRDNAQYAIQAVSKQQVDTDRLTLSNLEGQVASQLATVNKKAIRAPFTGRLGIVNVNPGQYLNVGDKITTLQTLDPIYIDFYLPQQLIIDLALNQTVLITSDAFPKQTFNGKITTIEPAIDTDTRNVLIEATVPNSQYQLNPGMFVSVEIQTGKPKSYLTIPQTAVSFNSYGDIVYVVKEKEKDTKGNPILTANQVFVVTGDTRGDQIAILKGLKENDVVVTSGQLKLKNGSFITINNKIQPTNKAIALVSNEHEG